MTLSLRRAIATSPAAGLGRDVAARASAGCAGGAVTAIGTATATAPNQVQVTWGNGAPPATTFNVYRKQGNCAALVPFTRIASGVASPYDDNTVSGSLTYAYQVTGLDSPSCSVESAPSGCVQATATGGCRLPPTFAVQISSRRLLRRSVQEGKKTPAWPERPL